ncbi:MAG: hypothetical protein ACRDQ5_11960, partial [Sciscionella sp.]
LPAMLNDTQQSLRDAGKALDGWRSTLVRHQETAIKLENEARRALGNAEQADARASTPIAYDANNEAAARAAHNAATKVAEAAEQAWNTVEEIRKRAQDLMDCWEDDASAVEDKLSNATDVAPGFWDAVGDAFADLGNLIMDNLGEIGDVAGMVAAVAGALSLVPGLNFLAAPVALAAGGVALLAHGAEMVKEGKWGDISAWVGLGTDALGMLPLVGPAAKGMADAATSLQVVDGLSTAAYTGARTFGHEAGIAMSKMADPAEMFTGFGNRVAGTLGGNPEVIAKAAQGGAGIVMQAPTAADMAIGNDTSHTAKDAGGWVSGGIAARQSASEWGDAAEGTGEAWASIKSFARAVG